MRGAQRGLYFPPGAGLTTNGLISAINVSAGTTSQNLSRITFSNVVGGVTFGLDAANSVITASAPAGASSPVNISAGTTSNDLTNLVFADSNRVSFGLNGSTVTAKHALNFSAGTTSNNVSDQLVFADSNRVSFGLNGSTVTAKHALNFSGGTTSNNVSDQLVFGNANNVSFGLNGSTLTATATVASTQGSIMISGGTTSNLGSVFVFTNSNNVSFTMNGSTINASASFPAQTNQTMGLYMSSNTTSSVSSGTVDARSMTFRGAGVASVGYSAGEVVISVPAGGGGITAIKVSAGTSSANISDITFANSNGVSFGLNGSTITGSVVLQATRSRLDINPWGSNGLLGLTNGQFWVQPIDVQEPLNVSRLNMFMSMTISSSSNSSHAGTLSCIVGIYTRNANTLSLSTSGLGTYAWTNTSNNSTSLLNIASVHRMSASINATNLTPGDYWIAVGSLTSTGNANWWTGSVVGLTANAAGYGGDLLAAPANSQQLVPGYGVFGASSTVAPASMAFTDIQGGGANARTRPIMELDNFNI